MFVHTARQDGPQRGFSAAVSPNDQSPSSRPRGERRNLQQGSFRTGREERHPLQRHDLRSLRSRGQAVPVLVQFGGVQSEGPHIQGSAPGREVVQEPHDKGEQERMQRGDPLRKRTVHRDPPRKLSLPDLFPPQLDLLRQKEEGRDQVAEPNRNGPEEERFHKAGDGHGLQPKLA